MRQKAEINRKLGREEFYTTFITLLGVNYEPKKRLTETEKKIVVQFMLLNEPKFMYNRFSSAARKRVRESLDCSDIYLNTYIDILKKKGYVTYDADNILVLAPSLEKIFKATTLELSFKFEIND